MKCAKPSITAITYADANFSHSAEWNLRTARWPGEAQDVRLYTPKDLEKDFIEKNEATLQQKRGAGYWLWKPYIILKALNAVNEGDYLMYMDAGAFYCRSIYYLVQQLQEDKKDILLSASLLPSEHWCKRDIFIKLGADNVEAYSSPQIEGGYMLLRKSAQSVGFIRQWLSLMTCKHLLDDSPSELGPELPSFRENRHDQSILTLLAYKEGIEPYRGVSNACSWGRYRWVKDGQCFGYTRKELWEYARKMKDSAIWHKSHYPRIAINTHITDNIQGNFYGHVLKETVRAVIEDIGAGMRYCP